jgi:serine/threonine protein kinase
LETPQFSSTSADVWKGQYGGREVAVKSLRVNPTGDLGRIRKELYRAVMKWRILRHPNVLPPLGVTVTENQFVMVSEWMENGNMNEYLKVHADANRLKLVCPSFIFICP